MKVKSKKWIIYSAIAIVVIVAIIFLSGMFAKQKKSSEKIIRAINPMIGNINVFISTTGVVQPKNRVEIKPAINGRVDNILVVEGDKVKKGQILAWMSSEDRAALLDAARSQGAETLKYWEDVYKPTPLIAPIDGEVIVRGVEPGQSVTTATAVLVISDRLIVVAQVDETDIGKVQIGQNAIVGLDAYPDVKARGKVDHISYESKTVSNVTIYEVDIVTDRIPSVFRSGMTADVRIEEKNKRGIMLLPSDAVKRDSKGSYVLLSNGDKSKPLRQDVVTGVSDVNNIEIISGLNMKDKIVVETKKFIAPQRDSGGSTSPFMPMGPRPRTQQRSSSRH